MSDKVKYQPKLAQAGFDAVLKLARWFDMLAKWKASVIHHEDYVSVSLHGDEDGHSYYASGKGQTLIEAMTAAEAKLKEDMAWNRRVKSFRRDNA